MKVIAREFSRQAGNEVFLRRHSLKLENLGKSNLTSLKLVTKSKYKRQRGHAF